MSLQKKRWLRALEIAKILFEDHGYHTRYLEEMEAFLCTEGAMSKEFTQAEAAAKVGRTVRSRVEFSGIPKGSRGKAVKADPMGHSLKGGVKAEVWDVVIEWEDDSRTKPIRDWFNKDEYEQFLEEDV